jgi:uncharacterized protein YdhG (YjbR/CyaY superfamily)
MSEVEQYLAAVPEPARATLEKLRAQIRSIVPDAEEVMSYKVPTFRHKGMLVSYAAFKDHCSLFLLSTRVAAEFAPDLKKYPGGKATVRFPIGKGLPVALVRKLVKARIAENEARKSA